MRPLFQWVKTNEPREFTFQIICSAASEARGQNSLRLFSCFSSLANQSGHLSHMQLHSNIKLFLSTAEAFLNAFLLVVCKWNCTSCSLCPGRSWRFCTFLSPVYTHASSNINWFALWKCLSFTFFWFLFWMKLSEAWELNVLCCFPTILQHFLLSMFAYFLRLFVCFVCLFCFFVCLLSKGTSVSK